MKKSYLFLSVLLLLPPAVFAHRLNEYLEATTISLSRGQVVLSIHLTPGTDVAAFVIKGIDLNGDGNISVMEQRAYVSALSRDLKLTLDGRETALTPQTFTFPTAEAMTKGVGDILIEYRAKLNPNPAHHLQLKNAHYSAVAVYLVNCLLPADTGIHVTGQKRNANQSVYQLEFTTNSTTAETGASLEKATNYAVIKTYLVHGLHHILTGYDHLLFLCALILGAATLWDLIKIVTAFTIAHSITLTLATFGLAHLPQQIVEPVIAVSIVFVALQNIVWPKQANGSSRLAVAFFFGLFHGLGFAGGLLELMHAMPTWMIWYAILGFSVGVEAGNQLVLLPLFGTLQWLKRSQNTTRMLMIQRYASAAVVIAGNLLLMFGVMGLVLTVTEPIFNDRDPPALIQL